MKKIKWKFIDNSKEVSGGFDVIFTPPIDSLRFFLLATPIDKIPEFIKGLLKHEGGGGDQFTYIETYSNLDEGDFMINNYFKRDEVKVVHHIFGDIIIKEKLFCTIFYDFGLKVLERNKQNKELNKEWKNEMIDGLEKLKEKFLNSDSL